MSHLRSFFSVCIVVISPLAISDDAPISLEGFADGVRHWQRLHDRFDYPRCKDSDTNCIADNLLRYQRASGGWPKNFDPSRLLSEEEKATLAAQRYDRDTTLDNRNVYTQITYLAESFQRTGDTRYRDAARKGVDYILNTQYGNGGWPHTPPRKDSYYGYITIADDVMTGVLRLLRDISEGQARYQFIEGPQREQVQTALQRGDALLLQLQYRYQGRLTGWAGQYDPVTLSPAQGRSFELVGLVTQESVTVVEYLMEIEKPSPEQVDAVNAALAWLNDIALEGFRVDEIKIEAVRYDYHSADYDRVVVEDASAPRIWARFYDLDTMKPFMANRDGTKVEQLDQVHHERRTGYAWYGYWPEQVLGERAQLWKTRTAQ